MTDRVIVLIDMDCFYCQVEARLNPSLKGHPVAVIQYNQWKGGGIIAVNYEAREQGVTRFMRGDDAKQHCPEIILVSVPTVRDKADLTRYREAGREVLSVLCRFSECVQRASIDEAYVDLTKAVDERMKCFTKFSADKWKSTFVVGYSSTSCNDEEERQKGFKAWLKDSESIGNSASLKLAIGALIVEEIREAIFNETSFRCSAGIAHNKILAKLACGLHKPNRQTILPLECVTDLYKTLPVKKIKNLGGKLGENIVEELGCQTMSDLMKFSEKELQSKYDEKAGSWLYNIARGIDSEPVTARLLSKSIGCCKKFPGRSALNKTCDVHHWLNKLAEELSERLLEDEVMNKRRANLLTVSFHLEINKRDTASSKSVALTSYNVDKIFTTGDQVLRKVCKIDPISMIWSPSLKYLGLSASKFSNNCNKILKFFTVSENSVFNDELITENKECKFSDENKSSFFQRILQQDVLNSNKKLNIVPDFSKNDLYIESDDSQSSLIKLTEGNQTIPEEQKKESIKKQLFTSELDSVQLNQDDMDLVNKISSLKKQVKENIPSKKKTIVNFFNQNKKENWVKPEELFPDSSEIDDELLQMLPTSYKNRILKIRKSNYSKIRENTEDKSDSCECVCDVNKKSEYPNAATYPTQCQECGEMVLDYLIHQDMHLALKLDKELNSGSQNIQNTVKVTLKTGNNKRKNETKGGKKYSTDAKKVRGIEKFFKK